jgi:predicted amidophosphoribosyltransferase
MGSSLFGRIASLVAPPLCAACEATTLEGAVLCDACKAALTPPARVIEAGPPAVDLAVAAAPFEGGARRIAIGLKYARRLSLARVAAESMVRALPPGETVDAVVPVPPGRWRWRWRGFDPAEELALAVSQRAGIPLCACLRRGGGQRQVGRRRAERLSDPPSVWAVRDTPRRALLVDDVWTTGATLSACARALREAGSRRIVALALARAF